ncbi:MAG: SDR family NAD(P)-dependent oxidoreductase [Myxococcota bacterium]
MAVSIDLQGRVALVAGGSSGIGLGIARRFEAAGATVHVTGTRARASDYGKESELEGLAYHCLDVADDGAVRSFADAFGALDVLVSSVGTVAYGGREFDIDTFRQVLDVNLNGVMHLCTSLRDRLRRQEGEPSSIVLVGSTSSFIATPGQPAYGASKGVLLTLTRCLAQAWAKHGIRVNGVAPGFVATRLTRRSREDEGVYAQTLQRIPLGRWGEPEEMGDVALFLASSMASYVTGQMLLADGGITLM